MNLRIGASSRVPGAVLLAAMLAAPAGAATTLFFEDFESYTSTTFGVTGTVAGMTVRERVDVLVPPTFSFLPGAVVDLDGSGAGPRGSGIGKVGFTLSPDRIYRLTLSASGNQRRTGTDDLFVEFEGLFTSPPPFFTTCRGEGLFAPLGNFNCTPQPSWRPFPISLRPETPFTEGSIEIRTSAELASFGFWIGTTSRDGFGPLVDWVRFTVEDLPAPPPGGGGNPPPTDQPPIIPTPNAIPEPATWALLIAGFGLVGGALRRRRQAAAA
ncbi:MAG: PEPxxWA-CTERM sorting domain-containing protein [Sphingomonadaceae bacterium]